MDINPNTQEGPKKGKEEKEVDVNRLVELELAYQIVVERVKKEEMKKYDPPKEPDRTE